MSYKNIDGLMQHLKDNNIEISGETEKRQLLNTGYFHGYKGYRFFKHAKNKIPFSAFSEVYATIQYDSSLKALIYPQMMFIETAVKNIALECILTKANSESIQDMYEKVVNSYNNCPAHFNSNQRKEAQQKKLNLQNTIQSYLAKAYKEDNKKIVHFYNNLSYGSVPLWALFEIMTLGDFGALLSCLNFDTRTAISDELGFNIVADTNRELVYKYIFTLKDLRNAVAHNSVVFDTRFSKIDPSPAMKQFLKLEINLPYINFKTIGDYIILICYYLKALKVSKNEILVFIQNFENVISTYKKAVNATISSKVVHPDTEKRMNLLKNYINS